MQVRAVRKSFQLAVAMMSVLPARQVEESELEEAMRRSPAWYPWVGLIIGMLSIVLLLFIGLGLGFLKELLQTRAQVPSTRLFQSWELALSPSTQSFIVGVSLLALTRMMHLDGLADVCDGLWGGYDAKRRQEILKDSRLGTFGTGGLVVSLAAFFLGIRQLIELHALIYLLWALCVSRFCVSLLCWRNMKSLHRGVGSVLIGKPRTCDICIAGAGLICGLALIVGATVLFGLFPELLEELPLVPQTAASLGHQLFGVVIPLSLSAVCAVVISHFLGTYLFRSFEGINGDAMGFILMMSELVVIVSLGVVL